MLCSQCGVSAYEERTRLFLGDSKSTQPNKLLHLSRWLKCVLGKAGIDTGIFIAHSLRCAATSAAACARVTTPDILKAANWSSKIGLYYKPVHSGIFGETGVVSSYVHGRLSLLTYNYRMAQPTKWVPALNMNKVKSNISTSHPYPPCIQLQSQMKPCRLYRQRGYM